MFVLHNLLAHQQQNAPAECIVEAKAALLALLAVRHPGAGFLTLKELVGGPYDYAPFTYVDVQVPALAMPE